ncbi:hypothetical protein XENOCAPTIV_030676, partial [Xenoophorus captivus]
LSLWPDQQHQHTFSNLTPSTEYSLLLLADNLSRSIILVATHFGEIFSPETQIKETLACSFKSCDSRSCRLEQKWASEKLDLL